MKNTPLSDSRIKGIVWVLLCVSPVIGMVVDLIAPSLPGMTVDLQTSSALTKATISIYLFSYALGNFISGFLTDAWGRQKLMLVGLLGFALFSLLPVLMPSIEMVLLARALQGFAIGTVAVVLRSIYSDILTSQQLVRFGVVMATMWGLGPVLGPVIGGYLQMYFGWKAGFFFFFVVTILLLIAIFFIVPETHFNRHPLNFKTMRRNIIEVLHHRVFIGLSILMGLTYSLLIAFNTVGPFLIQTHLHYSPIFYGHVALVLGLFFLAATTTCRYLLKYFSMEQLAFVTVNLFFAVVLLLLPISFLLDEINAIMLSSGCMFVACGFIFPLSMGKGMSLFRHIAGTATAIMFLINILITSFFSFILSFVSIHNATQLTQFYLLLMFMVLGIYWWVRKKSQSS